MDTRLDPAERLLDALEGAVVVSGRIDDGEGLLLTFQDGRCLVIAGVFALSLMRLDTEKLH